MDLIWVSGVDIVQVKHLSIPKRMGHDVKGSKCKTQVRKYDK